MLHKKPLRIGMSVAASLCGKLNPATDSRHDTTVTEEVGVELEAVQ